MATCMECKFVDKGCFMGVSGILVEEHRLHDIWRVLEQSNKPENKEKAKRYEQRYLRLYEKNRELCKCGGGYGSR